jgi:hypothetical protein
MTTQHAYRNGGKPISLRRLLAATAALPAAVAGLMMVFAAETPANAYDYTIAPTVFQFPGATTETLSGAFSFFGTTLLSVDLTLSGDGPGVAGVYDTLDAFSSQNDGFFASNGITGTGSIAITFADPLAGQTAILQVLMYQPAVLNWLAALPTIWPPGYRQALPLSPQSRSRRASPCWAPHSGSSVSGGDGALRLARLVLAARLRRLGASVDQSSDVRHRHCALTSPAASAGIMRSDLWSRMKLWNTT